jgi:hypothetical protein
MKHHYTVNLQNEHIRFTPVAKVQSVTPSPFILRITAKHKKNRNNSVQNFKSILSTRNKKAGSKKNRKKFSAQNIKEINKKPKRDMGIISGRRGK